MTNRRIAILCALLVSVPLFAASARLEPGAVVCETCSPQRGDFNGDGLDDLIYEGDLYFNRGGRFDAAILAPGLQKGNYIQAVGDFNNDGFDDVVTQAPGSPSRPQKLFLNNGSGGFTAGKALPEGAVDVVADLNADGLLDLVLITPFSFTLAVNNGDATFSPVHTEPWPHTKNGGPHGQTVVADFNSDGRADVFFTYRRYGYFYFANEDGTLAAPIRRYTYATLAAPHAADVNADGTMDIVAIGGLNPSDQRILVLFGDGTGRFPGFTYAFGDVVNGSAGSFAVGDFFAGGGVEIAGALMNGDIAIVGANGERLREIARVDTERRGGAIGGDFRADGTTDLLVFTQGKRGRIAQLVFTEGGAEAPSAATAASRGRSRAVRAGSNAVPDGRFEVAVTSACSANLSGLWNMRREGLFVNFDRIPGTNAIEAAAIDDEIHLIVRAAEGGAERVLEGSLTQKGNRITGILTESNPPCGEAWVAHFVEGTKR